MNEQSVIYDVSPDDTGMRIDSFITKMTNGLSRSYIQKLIMDGAVFLDGKPIKASCRLTAGQRISLLLPEPEELSVEPENIPLDILYEDKDIIVVNKPKDMVVHPAAGHTNGTLVNALLYHCRGNLSGINGVLRPGIVHRIDKDTTGVLVVCKTDAAHQGIAEQLKLHSITRKYNALVMGTLREQQGKVDAPVGRHPIDRKKMAVNYQNGKNAVTHYTVIETFPCGCSHIECTLETGRTHQIRVHMASIGHPLLGDMVYGTGKNPFHLEGQALHARVLGFLHPTTGKYMEFEAPLPDYFTELIDRLRKIGGTIN